MTLLRTWTVSLNNVPSQATLDAQGKAVTLAYANLLIAAGYTCEGSSNGTTGAMDAVNRWSTAANLIWEAAGSAHSWIVLKHPSRSQRVLIDLSTGATNQHLRNITWGATAFGGGAPTNLVAPTATTAGNARTYTNKQYLAAALANVKFHALRNTATDVLFFVSADGSGVFSSASGMVISANFETGDNHPVLSFESFTATAPGAFSYTNLNSTTHSTMWNNNDTIAASSTHGPVQYAQPGSASNVLVNQSNTWSSISGKATALPVLLYTGTAVTNSPRGFMVDIAAAPTGTGVASGTEEPQSPTPSETAIFGEFWVPCANVTPQL